MRLTLPSCPTLDLSLPGLTAFATERGPATDDDPYSAFNACGYTGDDPGHVSRCRREAALALGLSDPARLILPRQTHTANVAIVDAATDPQTLTDIDALVTADPSVAVGVSTADCVPLVLVDPVAGVCAAVHSGWRGTAGRIASRAVGAMASLGAEPGRIQVAMGPSICPECFEVGPEVADVFAVKFSGSDGIIRPGPGGKPHISLPRAITVALIEAGVRPESIAGPPACSRCAPRRFFSARIHGIRSGRTLTAARLAPAPARKR